MRRQSTRRATRLTAALAGLGLAGGLLGACGGTSSATLAQRACRDVSRSIALYRQSTRESGRPAEASRRAALVELRAALRPAALAGSAGGQFQALKATLSESSRVPEGRLITALSAQCGVPGTGQGAS